MQPQLSDVYRTPRSSGSETEQSQELSLESVSRDQRKIEALREAYHSSTIVIEEPETRISKALRTMIDLVVGPRARVNKGHGLSERELLDKESKIGADIFGEIPAGNRREFFYHDKTWIWYEEAINPQTGKLQPTTVRFEIQGDRVLKSFEGLRYVYIDDQEKKNFIVATGEYARRIQNEIPEYEALPSKFDLAA